MNSQNIMMMIVGVVVGALIAVIAYSYINGSEPMSERIGDAVDHVDQGDWNAAGREMTPQTRGEDMMDDAKGAMNEMADDVKEAVTPNTSPSSGI